MYRSTCLYFPACERKEHDIPSGIRLGGRDSILPPKERRGEGEREQENGMEKQM